MPTLTAKFSIKTPFLRYFLYFYGHLGLRLHPVTSANKKLSYLRLAYHFSLFFFVNWVYAQNIKSYDQTAEEVSRGKPLVLLSLKVSKYIYRPLYGIIFLYTLLYGPQIVKLLDRSKVVTFYKQSFLTKGQSKKVFLAIFLFDCFTFYFIQQYSFENLDFNKVGTYEQLRLFIQFVAHCEASLFYRLLQYGKWATWRSFTRLSIRRKCNGCLIKQTIRHLVEFNKKLNFFLSFPMLLESILFSNRILWSLCSRNFFSFSQMGYLLLPFGHIFLANIFSILITQTLAKKLIKLEKNYNKNKSKNKLVYFKQFVEMYKNVFNFSLFSLVKINNQFLLFLFLFLSNYALLINQTT